MARTPDFSLCADCELALSIEATKNIGLPFEVKKFRQEYYRLRREKYERFCEHFTIEYWEKLGFEANWGDAAVRNYPHLTILRWSDGTETKFCILAPFVTRRPVILNALDPNAWGSY